ncbi:TetR/AcrR family transcriptional regulator [Kitasatospora sp. NPDC093806]|uniref:TetR/AcrR family transcriptional regulator n=1 Tax=Kitasatospora sp. NPDC093806 TaxID=3155075 RepID=UPI00343DBB8F
MGVTRTPRGRWVEEGLRALAGGGPEAVRVEALAQVLGVTKGGFYGYFRNREALLAEMLDTWEREVTEGVIARVEEEGGDARTRLGRLFRIAATSVDGPVTGTGVDLAIREWARRDEAVAERLRRVDNRRMGYLRSLFGSFCADPAEVEMRSFVSFTLRVGYHMVDVDHGGLAKEDVMVKTREWLLS